MYFVVGGMPEAVLCYAQNQSLHDVAKVHQNLVQFCPIWMDNKWNIWVNLIGELEGLLKRLDFVDMINSLNQQFEIQIFLGQGHFSSLDPGKI